MDELKFTIHTTMGKEDYRKFLYLATFAKNKMILPGIGGLSIAVSFLVNYKEEINYFEVILLSLLLFVVAIFTVCFKVERKNKLRINTDKTRTFNSENVFDFYNDKVVMKNEMLKSTGELKYSQFYNILETKDYFIFYLTVTQAFLVRKKDVTEVEEFKEFLEKAFQNKYKHI